MMELLTTEEKPGSTMNVSSALWPELGGGNENVSKIADGDVVDNGDWEFVSEASSQGSSEDAVVSNSNPQFFHKSTSSPALSIYEHYSSNVSEEKKSMEDDDESSFDHCSCSVMSIEAHSVRTESSSSHVLVSHTTPEKPLTRRVPSFRDAILLNAQEAKKEEATAAQLREQAKRLLWNEALAKRKASKPRLLVVKTPPKISRRNSKSTGDLNCLMHSNATIYEDHEDHEDDMCGGGGGGFDTVQEHDVMGDTDATDFYAQKSKGGSSRMNSKKLRPDEAKRLDIILHKKEEQKKKQREREIESSSGRKTKTVGKKNKGR